MSEPQKCFYRVSAKALIIDAQGRVLVCKEEQPHWSLPGGGIDHGESAEQALMRELHEELGITDVVSMKASSVHTVFIEDWNNWLMWIVFEVALGKNDIAAQQGVDDMAFIDPLTFEGSERRSEKLVYKSWAASSYNKHS